MDELLVGVLSSGGVALFLAVLLVMNPEKVERWAALLNKGLSKLGWIFKSAHKRYVKHDLQARINSFTKVNHQQLHI